ncbi:hypothetical protein ACOMHN_003956 [Nucella lapillus]
MGTHRSVSVFCRPWIEEMKTHDSRYWNRLISLTKALTLCQTSGLPHIDRKELFLSLTQRWQQIHFLVPRHRWSGVFLRAEEKPGRKNQGRVFIPRLL